MTLLSYDQVRQNILKKNKVANKKIRTPYLFFSHFLFLFLTFLIFFYHISYFFFSHFLIFFSHISSFLYFVTNLRFYEIFDCRKRFKARARLYMSKCFFNNPASTQDYVPSRALNPASYKIMYQLGRTKPKATRLCIK